MQTELRESLNLMIGFAAGLADKLGIPPDEFYALDTLKTAQIALDAICEHFPWVLMGLRPSTREPFAVCQACGDTGVPTERNDFGFGKIVWDGKPLHGPPSEQETNGE